MVEEPLDWKGAEHGGFRRITGTQADISVTAGVDGFWGEKEGEVRCGTGGSVGHAGED